MVTYKNVPQGFHAELFVESVSSTPWNDLAPVLAGNISQIINLNTTAFSGPWTKNFYLQLEVPDDATIGLYEGYITFETAGGVQASTFIQISVKEGKGKILYAKMFTDWGIDNFLGQLLLKSKINCYIVNGQYPKRLEAILRGKKTINTLIS